MSTMSLTDSRSSGEGLNCGEILYEMGAGALQGLKESAVGVLKGVKFVVLSSFGVANTCSAACLAFVGSKILFQCATNWGGSVSGVVWGSVIAGTAHLQLGVLLTLTAIACAAVAYITFKDAYKVCQG